MGDLGGLTTQITTTMAHILDERKGQVSVAGANVVAIQIIL
jgi:hypothetical protein